LSTQFVNLDEITGNDPSLS